MLASKSTMIYGLTCPHTGKVRYVGKSDNPLVRLNSHLSNLKNRTPKVCWIRSLLKDGYRPGVVLLELVDSSLWEDAERRWIAKLREGGADLLNYLDGGEGWPSGRPHSLETRKKMSDSNARRGKPTSLYQKERARQARLGYKKKGSSSQFLGVHWWKTGRKWHASIVFDGRRLSLGNYICETDAARAYNLRALELYGTGALLNDLPQESVSP